MQEISLILLSAGDSSRFGLRVKKQWLYQGETPLWLKVVQEFQKSFKFKEIVVVVSEDEIRYVAKFADYKFVVGGSSRQKSLSNALEVVKSRWVMVSDIARCCVDKKVVKRVIKGRKKGDVIVPIVKAVDTLYKNNRPIDREEIKVVQTPQLSRVSILKKALSGERSFSDESSAVEAIGGKVHFVKGSQKAHKLTYRKDILKLSCLKKPSNRVWRFGVDVHRFEDGKEDVSWEGI